MVWILNKLLGSDLDLKGPNLENAPLLELDFSGTKLRYRDPMHTAMFPVDVFAEDMDIYEPTNYNRQKEGDLAKRFYNKGWAFRGRSSRGGVDLSGRIFYFDNKRDSNFNCFEISILEDEILEFCHSVWGNQNESERVGDLGTGLFAYPASPASIESQEINGIRWCRFTSQVSGKPPRIFYAYPLTSNHLLLMGFTLLGYLDTDFYSPETNLEQATLAFVDEFMANFYIELSPESKAQRAAAKNPV